MNHAILIIDDEAAIRTSLRGILEDEGYVVLEAASGEEGLARLGERTLSAVLLDIWMEGMDGIETLRRIKQGAWAELPVIMMSGHGTIDTAVEATKSGAYDFLEKPLSLERVLLLLERAIRELALVRENKALRERMRDGGGRLIGQTPVMVALDEQIRRVAPTSMWVLITGEPGAGKEVAARRLHELSQRAEGPFVVVNSAALAEEHIESELFGQEKGAFPGAAARPGRFEQANGGILFLDEITDMSLKTQAKILGILQERRFERVGGGRGVEVDVRVIAASNRDLEEEVAQGRLRGDLYYRLAVVPLRVPSLRERPADIPLLVQHFLELSRGLLPQYPFSQTVLARLMAYRWPGNVRELKNLVERLLIMSSGPTIEEGDLPEFLRQAPPAGAGSGVEGGGVGWPQLLAQPGFREARELFEKEYLRLQLERSAGNISRTADVIGMERSALHRKLKGLGLG